MILNLGPYLVEFSQTVNELLMLKSFSERNWEQKSKLNKFCLVIIVCPIGPFVIAVKKYLRLLQGVSVLIVDLKYALLEKSSAEKRQ